MKENRPVTPAERSKAKTRQDNRLHRAAVKELEAREIYPDDPRFRTRYIAAFNRLKAQAAAEARTKNAKPAAKQKAPKLTAAVVMTIARAVAKRSTPKPQRGR
jgi:hypothetical protein